MAMIKPYTVIKGPAVMFAATFIACAAAPAWSDPAASGPKKRVAVADFTAISAFQTAAGGPEAGVAMAQQLDNALAASGAVVVIDHDVAATVLSAPPGAPPPPVQLAATKLGAQVVVRGMVTNFETGSSGSDTSLGLNSGAAGAASALVGAFGRKATHGSMVVTIKIIDAETGRVIASNSYKEPIDTKALSASVTASQGSLSQNNFKNTAIGEATGHVFAEAVPFIADKLREMAWVGRVADIDGGMVTLNAGETAGVHAGDTFTVLREIKRVTDPQTGEVLRVVQAPIGQVQVFEVQERSSTAKPADGTVAQVGDTVQFVKP